MPTSLEPLSATGLDKLKRTDKDFFSFKIIWLIFSAIVSISPNEDDSTYLTTFFETFL